MKVLDGAGVSELVRAFRQGNVVCLPTDTVYGLFCDAGNERSVHRIFKIKDRSLDKPLGIFVKDVETAKSCAEISEKQERILRKYWPGKVTFVLKKRKDFCRGVGTENTIGIRIPDFDLFERQSF